MRVRGGWECVFRGSDAGFLRGGEEGQCIQGNLHGGTVVRDAKLDASAGVGDGTVSGFISDR